MHVIVLYLYVKGLFFKCNKRCDSVSRIACTLISHYSPKHGTIQNTSHTRKFILYGCSDPVHDIKRLFVCLFVCSVRYVDIIQGFFSVSVCLFIYSSSGISESGNLMDPEGWYSMGFT